MRTILYIISFILFLISFNGYSQKVQFGGEIGYHWFKMNELRTFNNRLVKSLPFDAQITTHYPAYYNNSLFIGFGVSEKLDLGLRYNFTSTGSRISSIDYSGTYYLNTTLKLDAFSIYLSTPFYNKLPGFLISGLIDLGYSHTNLAIHEEIEIFENFNQSDKFVASANSFFIIPSVAFSYEFIPFAIGIRTGYQYDFKKGDFVDLENLDNTSDLKPDWSGLFINFSMALKLKLKELSKESQLK